MPSVVNKWVLNLVAPEQLPHALDYGAGYLWVGLESDPGRVLRIDPTSPNTYADITFPIDGDHAWVLDLKYIASKNKVYALFGNAYQNINLHTTLAEIDPVTLAHTDVILDTSYNVEQGSFTNDSTYIYIVSRLTSYIYRYNLSNFAFVDKLYLPIPWPHCCRYDSETGNIFVTSSSQYNGYVAILSITASTFTINQQSVIDHDRIFTDDLAFTPGFVWVGSEATGTILRISKTNLSSVTTAYLGNGNPNYCVYYDGESIWTAWGGTPGVAGKMNPATLAMTLYTFPGANQYNPNEIVRFGNTIYFTFYIAGAATVSAMDVPGISGPPGPGNLGFSETLSLSDGLSLSALSPPGIFILDSINLLDKVTTDYAQQTPNIDSLVLVDSVRYNFIGSFDLSDALSLSDSAGLSNDLFSEVLNLADALTVLLGGPTIEGIGLNVFDYLQLLDNGQMWDRPQSLLVGDRIIFEDKQGVIEGSTLDGYLRRYLNDVRR